MMMNNIVVLYLPLNLRFDVMNAYTHIYIHIPYIGYIVPSSPGTIRQGLSSAVSIPMPLEWCPGCDKEFRKYSGF